MALTPAVKKQLIEDTCAMIEEMGGVGALHEDLAEFHELWMRMLQEYDSLLETYPSKWAAMGKGGALAIADSRDDAFDTIEGEGIPRKKAIVEFLDPDPPLLIL